MGKDKSLKKELGLVMATALVAGNMMGSGIFMLPATLASKSGPLATMIAWGLTGVGSICLALSFAKLGSKIPKTGGPYEYSKLAFGDFIGFINAWLYWNGSWIGNAAIITVIASYTATLIPIISNNHFVAFLYTSCILWIFTIINILGVKKAGILQTTITIFELILFICFIGVAAYHFKPSLIGELLPKGKGIETIPSAAASTLWAFIGFETASVTAGEIRNPEKNVKRSTILGITIAIVMYMLISFFAMGAMSQKALSESTSPIADIMAQFLGKGVSKLVLVGAIICVLGTTVGWILTTARMSYAAGKDKVFPEFFAKVHPKYNTPHVSLIISGVLCNVLLLMNYTKSLIAAFNFIILLATLAYLPMYAFTAAAEIMLLVKTDKDFTLLKFIKNSFVPLIGFSYAVWAIYGSGSEAVMYGFILMLLGIPFYLYMKLKDYVNINQLRNIDYSEVNN